MLASLIQLINYPLSLCAVLIAFISALFICLPAHEFAHAHAAVREGDITPKALKRYTLSPFAHIDPMGFVLLLFFGFGFAKPVPVNPANFKRGTFSKIRVSLAGVLTNLGIGIIACFIYALIQSFWPEFFVNYGFISEVYYYFFEFCITLNFWFAFFNILPIYPLDGFRLVESFSRTENGYIRFMKRFSFWILLLLLITDIVGLYLNFVAGGSINIILDLFSKFFMLFK